MGDAASRRTASDVVIAVAGPDKLDAARTAAAARPRRPPRRRVRPVGRRGADLLHDLGALVARRPGAARARRARSRRPATQQRAWAARAAAHDVPHADLVRRSLLTLLLLTHAETGGIVAAPTTSLPEDFGGERNWDYRFCWLRDAALTLESLLGAGYDDRGAGVARLAAARGRRRPGGPADHVHRRRRPPAARDASSPTCPGYADSLPVRIGNGAVCQRQNDVLGEVMIALELRATGRAARDRELVGPAAGAGRRAGRALGRARQRPVGDPRPAAALHPLPRHGLGRLRPRDPRRRGARPGGPGGALARAARPGARRGARQGLRRGARHLHPALRHRRGRRLAAHPPARRLPAGRRPAGARHDRRGRGGPDARRPAAALPHRLRRRRPERRRAPVPRLLVLAGLRARGRGPSRRRPRS